MIEHSLKTFVNVVVDYFQKTTPTEASVGDPYICFGQPEFLTCNGLVSITGAAEGFVLFSSNSDMLEMLAQEQGENLEGSEEVHDFLTEVANVMTSNVRRDFGENFKVSTPTFLESEKATSLQWPQASFIMPINWKDFCVYLIIALNTMPEMAEISEK